MYNFTYHKASSVADAVKQLSSAEDGKLMAGGMTLIPTLKQRLAKPSDVIDLGKIAELQGVKRDGNTIVIGAMTKHADVAASAVVKGAIPALAQLAEKFSSIDDWSEESVMGAVNAVLKEHGLKLPKIAMPLRLIVFGRAQTPNLGPTLAVAGKVRVLGRLREHLAA